MNAMVLVDRTAPAQFLQTAYDPGDWVAVFLKTYRTGDVARWLSGPCACGLPFRRLSAIRGRVDEQVSCAWGNLHPEFFVALLASVPGGVNDWQVALQERDLVPVLEFRLETDGSASRDAVAGATLDAATMHQAKRAVLDASAGILTGRNTPEGRAVLSLIGRTAASGVCVVPGSDLKCSRGR